MNETSEIAEDRSIDLRGEVCPMNFVKTKLILEEMNEGEVLKVTLDAGDPMRNVPRSIKEEGHQIVSVKKEGEIFHLWVKRFN